MQNAGLKGRRERGNVGVIDQVWVGFENEIPLDLAETKSNQVWRSKWTISISIFQLILQSHSWPRILALGREGDPSSLLVAGCWWCWCCWCCLSFNRLNRLIFHYFPNINKAEYCKFSKRLEIHHCLLLIGLWFVALGPAPATGTISSYSFFLLGFGLPTRNKPENRAETVMEKFLIGFAAVSPHNFPNQRNNPQFHSRLILFGEIVAIDAIAIHLPSIFPTHIFFFSSETNNSQINFHFNWVSFKFLANF